MISFVLRQKLRTKDFHKNVDFYTKKGRCNEHSKTHKNEPAGIAGEFEYIQKGPGKCLSLSLQLFELLQIDASRVLLAALLDNQECRAAESGRELNAIRASLTCEVLLRNNLA